MHLKTLLAAISGSASRKRPATMDYEDIFKGAAAIPMANPLGAASSPSSLILSGNDTDAYFKDVFAGPVF